MLPTDPDHVMEQRSRGRISQWLTWITDAAGIDFPYVEQGACIRRNIYTSAGTWIRKEHAWIITSGQATTITAADLSTHVRQHWGIENKNHYPRDTIWREDAQQVYTAKRATGSCNTTQSCSGTRPAERHQQNQGDHGMDRPRPEPSPPPARYLT
jgi:hypothetical protein